MAGLDIEGMTLREALWAVQQSQRLQAQRLGSLMAAMFNVQRTKRADKVWTWEDFFESGEHRRRPTGREVLLAQMTQHAGDIQWLAGYGPEVLSGE
jgi:hypothetical protein